MRKGLIDDARVPDWMKHVFLIVVFSSIAILVTSNLSIGASVDMVINTNTTTLELPSLFAFSLGNTASELWQSRIYALLLIVVIFSGIWPYVKLILIGLAWVLPTGMLDENERGQILATVDALSKFSLVDTYVLVLMMVSFRFHLSLGEVDLDVFINPAFGFYGFLVATTLSLLVGHVALYMHRRSSLSGRTSGIRDDIIARHRTSVLSYRFQSDGTSIQASKTLRRVAFVLPPIIVAMIVIGAFRKSFTFEVGGLAGALQGDGNNEHTYSLVSLGLGIADSVQHPGIGVKLLQGVYFFYSMATPVICLVALFVLAFVPLSVGAQKQALVVAEVANAWSAVEIFVLSVLVALFEISTFAGFIVGDKCNVINQILSGSNVLPGDNKCFSLSTTVRPSVWILLVGVLLNSFIVSVLLRYSRAVIDARTKQTTGLDNDSPRDDDDDDAIDDMPERLEPNQETDTNTEPNNNNNKTVPGLRFLPSWFFLVSNEASGGTRMRRADTETTMQTANKSSSRP